MNGKQGMCDTKPGQEGLPSFHHRHHLLESGHIGPWGHSLPQTLPHLPRGQSYQPTKWEARWKSERNGWAVGETWRSRAENSHREDRTLKALLQRSDWVVWLNSTVSSFSLRWVKTVHERRQSPHWRESHRWGKGEARMNMCIGMGLLWTDIPATDDRQIDR